MARQQKPFHEAQHEDISDIPNLSGMSEEEILDAIEGWVLSNFEDPVHDTPHDSSEGGYQYIWGGPYETRDIVETMFGDVVSEEIIEQVVSRLENETSEWVPNSRRRVPPEEEDEFEDDPANDTVEEAYERVLDEVKQLEEMLSEIPDEPAGMGHNLPPEPLSDPLPIMPADKKELYIALETLKTQTPTPADGGVAATAAMAVIEAKRKTLLGWLAEKADAFASEAAKEAGKEFGKWGMRGLIGILTAHMTGLDQAVMNWLSKLL